MKEHRALGEDAQGLAPLTLSVLSWRHRQLWECVVMRRKSPQMAKEEILEASWEGSRSDPEYAGVSTLKLDHENHEEVEITSVSPA